MSTPSKSPRTDTVYELACHSHVADEYGQMVDLARTLEIELGAAVAKLQIDQWIKGQWQCPTCKFTLSKNVLSVRDGNVYANAEPFNEICPNDGAIMRPLTYKDSYHDICKCCEQQVERAVKAEQQNTSLLAQIAVKDEALNKIWWEDDCGWIMHNDKPVECGKCGAKVLITTLEVEHEDYCIQGILHNALTNSPAAAKELLEQNERMKVALEAIATNTLFAGQMIITAQNALSTPIQPVKEQP